MLKMSAYEKELQSKRETSQIGLFDMTDSHESSVHFELEKCEPLSFEARMKGEKAIIGYPVSGHPLDGIEDFIRAKSKNMGPILEWIASLDEPHLERAPVESIAPGESEKESLDDAPLPEEMPADVSDEENVNGDEIIEPTPPELPPIEEEKEESIFAQLIGVVGNIRKMQTKS